MAISPMAGKPADPSLLTDIPRLISAYYTLAPDPGVREQRVSFGTSGHRGSSLKASFNEAHILATTEAIYRYRAAQKIDGPLFVGIDTHALSEPAMRTALEVLAAHGVEVRIAEADNYTPTPAISHAILTHNRGRADHLADGIVITPSHNPPGDGGFKYNPPHGGPAESSITKFVETEANAILEAGLAGVERISYEKALKAETTKPHDFVSAYVADLEAVVDVEAIHESGLKLGVDPLGGAGVYYWGRIAEWFRFDQEIVNPYVDHTFRFLTLDWDGKIRMDPSSQYAMQSLIGLKDRFDVAFACDTDHDRHGIVVKSRGLMQPNHYLSVCVDYLFQNRPEWRADSAVGKTAVSSGMIDRVAQGIGREVYEVPVGFKYFVDGLASGDLGFGGEESAGASFLRKDGSAWSTDKDGMILALLAAEMTAKTGRDPGELYGALTEKYGDPAYARIDAPATPEQKSALAKLSPEQVESRQLAGEAIAETLTKAPGDGNDLGGLKVVTANGWFAARPSGTEDIYKIYAESFLGEDHLKQIQAEAQEIVAAALRG